MNSNAFTPAESLMARSLLRTIYRDDNLRPAREDARIWKNTVEQLFQDGTALRDVFGQNKVVVALETIRLAAEEIGLRGDVFPAFLLFTLMDNPQEQIPRLKDIKLSILYFLKGFASVKAIEAKTEAMKTDDFRNFFVSQAGDMRIVLLLIAHCVVLMGRVKDTPAVKEQKKLSVEASCIYAPLAHKLGLYKLKSVLEDLSLKYLEPDAYYLIKEKLSATKQARDEYVERFIAPVRKMLDEAGLRYHVKGRTKSIHSIRQKMKKQQCGFEGVFDLFAIRIIIDAPVQKEKEQCWRVFSLITNRYEFNLKRMRDWLSVPKSNGYESLHITVLGPENKWVEVQIRSERMDEIAEHGLAAHWRYKGIKSSEGEVDAWLADIRNALETGNEKLLTENLSSKGNASEVYVFTPKGDLYRLPAGATILDFAYYIHSNVGNHCVGGKVNGRNTSIRGRLESGTTVEILTSATQKPRLEWLNIVVSSHAKSKIRSAVYDLQTREGVMARELFERKLKNRKMEWDEGIVNRLVKSLGFKESREFYKAISEDRLSMTTVIERYAELVRRAQGLSERAVVRSAEEYVMDNEPVSTQVDGEDVLVIDRNLKGIDFQMARCCNPVYGDAVFGFVTSGGGIKIHRDNCPNAPALRQRFGYRIVPARWAGKGGGKYPIVLKVIGQDDLGVVNNITSIISKEEHIMLRSISIDSEGGLFSGVLTVLVDDNEVLNKLLKKLRTVKGVKAVSRT